MCTTCFSGCGCGLHPIGCCCCLQKELCHAKKPKYDEDSYGKFDDLDKEIIYSEASSDDNKHNGYDVEVNDYPLDQLEKDFTKQTT